MLFLTLYKYCDIISTEHGYKWLGIGMRREKEMTRKKKVIIIIASALAAVLVLGAVAFTIYRNVQLERLRVYIVDSLLEKDGKPYSLSDRKTMYDATNIIAVYQFDEKSFTDFLLENNTHFRDAMSDDEFRNYYYSGDNTPSYTVTLHSDEIKLSSGSSSQEGYYKCELEIYNGKWNVYSEGPYISASECTPTEFVRRIL